MRRELGQLSLTDGLVDSGAGVTGSWSGSRRWSTGRASSGCSAVMRAGRAAVYGPVLLLDCLC